VEELQSVHVNPKESLSSWNLKKVREEKNCSITVFIIGQQTIDKHVRPPSKQIVITGSIHVWEQEQILGANTKDTYMGLEAMMHWLGLSKAA
jgi:hypothetical protein